MFIVNRNIENLLHIITFYVSNESTTKAQMIALKKTEIHFARKCAFALHQIYKILQICNEEVLSHFSISFNTTQSAHHYT